MGNESDFEQDDEEATQSHASASDNNVAILQLHEHRWVENQIEIRVEWATGEQTWEAEDVIHEQDKRLLIQHWESAGGRPSNPDHPGELNVFAILAVRPFRRSQQFLIEWTGIEEPTWQPVDVLVDASGDEMYYYECRLSRNREARQLGEQSSHETVDLTGSTMDDSVGMAS